MWLLDNEYSLRSDFSHPHTRRRNGGREEQKPVSSIKDRLEVTASDSIHLLAVTIL